MGRKKIMELTDSQRETLAEICRYLDENGYPPTVQELADIFGVSAPSIHDRLNQLIDKGYLRRTGKKARGLRVVRCDEDITIKLTAIPVIGVVAAGVPILAQENIIGEVLVEETLVRSGTYFALRVSGDSMINAGINDGDIVIVKRQPIAENGDIVVALLGDEATVKRLRITPIIIELVPENPKLKPIVINPEDDLRIIGKVIAHRHTSIRTIGDF